MIRRIVALLVISCLPCLVHADNWPSWRGPHGDGRSVANNPPTQWSAKENIAWKSEVPGIGHSSPIIWGDRVFLTSCLQDKEERVLLCYDRKSGKLLWQREVLTSPLEKKHRLNSFASSTPATDGKHVYVAFLQAPDVRIMAYDFDGKKVWDKSPGKFFSRHGFCSSPILYKNKVIVNCDQDAKAYIVALDKESGEELWRIDRPNRTRSYCVPVIVEAAGKTQMVLSGSKCVTSYDPDTGKQLWIINGPTEQYVASLVFTEGVFFLTAGFPTYHNMGILPDGSGDVTMTHILWHENKVSARKASYVPSPIAHGKYFFLVTDSGFAHCFDAKTGKRQWEKALGRHHSASPVSANDLLYFLDDDGDTFVIKAGPKFELIARNSLDEKCYASPAIANNQLFIRSEHHLWCIGTNDTTATTTSGEAASNAKK